MSTNLSAWLIIAVSVVSEVVGTIALKQSDGFSKPIPSGAAAACYALAVWLMAVAMRRLDMGITYAVWAASGAAATAIVGIIFYGEQIGGIKAFGLVCVIGGVAMLNLGSHR